VTVRTFCHFFFPSLPSTFFLLSPPLSTYVPSEMLRIARQIFPREVTPFSTKPTTNRSPEIFFSSARCGTLLLCPILLLSSLLNSIFSANFHPVLRPSPWCFLCAWEKRLLLPAALALVLRVILFFYPSFDTLVREILQRHKPKPPWPAGTSLFSNLVLSLFFHSLVPPAPLLKCAVHVPSDCSGLLPFLFDTSLFSTFPIASLTPSPVSIFFVFI